MRVDYVGHAVDDISSCPGWRPVADTTVVAELADVAVDD
jgi:hypothetical protein